MAGLAIAACLAGCGAQDPPHDTAGEELQGAVLILLDTVRADHLGCYGYHRPTSPNLDALARAGVKFEQAVSPSPWTLPSVAALLAAEYPQRVLKKGQLLRSLVERLSEAGITAAAFTEGGYVSRAYGLDRGFDHYEEEEGPVQLLKPGERRDPNTRGGIEHTFAMARRWLSRNQNRRFFLFIHTYEPHTPYTNDDFTQGIESGLVGPVFAIDLIPRIRSRELVLNDADVEYVKALYDGDILNSDLHVGEFLTFLEDRGLRDRTLLVITSDHGEELNDHYPQIPEITGIRSLILWSWFR